MPNKAPNDVLQNKSFSNNELIVKYAVYMNHRRCTT